MSPRTPDGSARQPTNAQQGGLDVRRKKGRPRAGGVPSNRASVPTDAVSCRRAGQRPTALLPLTVSAARHQRPRRKARRWPPGDANTRSRGRAPAAEVGAFPTTFEGQDHRDDRELPLPWRSSTGCRLRSPGSFRRECRFSGVRSWFLKGRISSPAGQPRSYDQVTIVIAHEPPDCRTKSSHTAQMTQPSAGYRSLKPGPVEASPSAADHRCVTPVTRPGAPAPESLASSCSHRSRRTFGDDQHPPVVQIGGGADQAQLESPRPHPPPEADALHLAPNPGREPHRRFDPVAPSLTIAGAGVAADSAGRRTTIDS